MSAESKRVFLWTGNSAIMAMLELGTLRVLRLPCNRLTEIPGEIELLRSVPLNVIDSGLVGSTDFHSGGVPQEQKMLEGHLPSVVYHQVYLYTKIDMRCCACPATASLRSRAKSSSSGLCPSLFQL